MLRHTRTATHCNTLQHTATHCNTLLDTVKEFNALQHTATHKTRTTWYPIQTNMTSHWNEHGMTWYSTYVKPHSYVTWLIGIYPDSSICAITHILRVTWLIHIWHVPFIRDTSHRDSFNTYSRRIDTSQYIFKTYWYVSWIHILNESLCEVSRIDTSWICIHEDYHETYSWRICFMIPHMPTPIEHAMRKVCVYSCSVLQYVAMCSVLQYVAMRCSMLQHVAGCQRVPATSQKQWVYRCKTKCWNPSCPVVLPLSVCECLCVRQWVCVFACMWMRV